MLTQTPTEAQRLPQVNSPKSPPTGSHPPTADHLKIPKNKSSLPFGLVKTEEMRSGTSKSLGLAEVCRLKTQPNRRISHVLRPKPRNLRIQMASETSFWPPGAQKTLKSDFSKNATPSTRKPCFLRSGGCQNGAKMAPKMLRKLSSGAGGLRESLRELLEAQEAPQRLPRAPRENPRSVPGGPKEVQNEPQEAPN